MSNGSDIKPTDLRGILKYVPRFQGQTFVIALDGIIVADDNFPNILTDIAVLRSLGIKIIIIHGIGHQLEELSKLRNIPITDVQRKGVADPLGAPKIISLTPHEGLEVNGKPKHQISAATLKPILEDKPESINEPMRSPAAHAVKAVETGTPRIHLLDGRLLDGLLNEI